MNKTRKKDAKPRKAVRIIPQQGAIKKFAALERLRMEHSYLRDRLNAPERWLPFLELSQPGVDPATVLKQMRSRLTKIRELRTKAEGKYRMEILPATQALTAQSAAMTSADQAGGSAGEWVYGTVDQATAQSYFLPDAGGPNGNCPVIALRREGGATGYWVPTWPELPSHAAGLAAYQEGSNWDMIWFIPCFQFTFPAPRLDCTLSWSLIISALVGFERDADWGWVSFQPLLKVQPSAGSFPVFEEFSFISDTQYITESLPSNVRRNLQFPLSGSFEVQQNTQSNLYVGLGVQLSVSDGCVGIPNCSEGKSATINSDLWNMGLVEVFWDTGRSNPLTKYQLGVQYNMFLHG